MCRVTRMIVLIKGCHWVAAKASPAGKTSTVRSSWRDRALFRENAVSAGVLLSATVRAASNRLAWFALSWTSRWFPVLRAASNVFLTVHGVQGEQTTA